MHKKTISGANDAMMKPEALIIPPAMTTARNEKRSHREVPIGPKIIKKSFHITKKTTKKKLVSRVCFH